MKAPDVFQENRLLITRPLVTDALALPRLPLPRLLQAVSLEVLIISLLRVTPLLGLTRLLVLGVTAPVSPTLLFLVEVLFFCYQ